MQQHRVSYKSKYLEAKDEVERLEQELESVSAELAQARKKLDQVEGELASTDKEAQEYLDHLRRLKAEFENYRKRVHRERERVIAQKLGQQLKEFLPVLDDLERALGSDADEVDAERLLQGVQLIYDQSRRILAREGLEEIKALGEPFDPTVHEAVGTVNSAEYEDGMVAQEVRKGYRFNDRVLRPTLVMVNRRDEAGPARQDAT